MEFASTQTRAETFQGEAVFAANGEKSHQKMPVALEGGGSCRSSAWLLRRARRASSGK